MRRWTARPAAAPGPAAAPPGGAYADGPAPLAWDVRTFPRRRVWRDRAAGAVLLVVAGAAAALGQVPWSLWPLALAAYALGVAVIARAAWPGLAAGLMGTAHFAVALHWLVEPFRVDPAATGWLAWPALAAAAVGLSLFWAVGAALGARLGGRGPARALGAATGLALAELARAWAFTGFPWAMPGHVLIDTAALPAASFAGAHGLTLAVLLGAGLVAAARPWAAALGLAAWAAPFALAWTLPPAPPAAADAPVIRLVQPNAPQAQKWDPDFVQLFWERGLRETAAPGAVDAVAWPETSLPMLLGRADHLRPVIARAAGGVPAVVGAQRYGPQGQPRNAAVLLTGPEGDVGAIYDKHHLAPFGEYLPLPWLARALGIGPMASRLAGTFRPGEGPAILEVPGIGPVMPMICYEAIFPQYIGRVARPRLLLHLTNDAWFGGGAGPRQHLALARLRAAESGLPLLRAANTGISAAIDARGRVLASLPLGEAGHLDAPVTPALAATPYARTGDLTALMLLLALATAIFARRGGAED